MKEVLSNHGYEEGQTGSPRMVIKLAYKTGIIDDEEKWLEALISRNNVAHAYHKAIAIVVIIYLTQRSITLGKYGYNANSGDFKKL